MTDSAHPFSAYVAILGRGKTKQRHLTREEARAAMGMILDGAALPEQIGAFLMLLRLKEESPEEVAGFVEATRARMARPGRLPRVDLDWSSYAGKRRQLPWFLLSVLTLVGEGVRVLMHGTEGHTEGRLYTRAALERLGIAPAPDLAEAAARIEETGLAYVPLEALSPVLRRLIDLRPILGLRSPVHSFARMLNPLEAPVMMQGIFHRGFMEIHAGAARLLGQPVMAVFRGEGGEIERRPNKPTELWITRGREGPCVEHWPALLPEGHVPADDDMSLDRLAAVWDGSEEDAYAVAAVIGTLALALRALGRAEDIAGAEALARRMWQARDRGRLPGAR